MAAACRTLASTLQNYTDAGVTGIGGAGQPSLSTINDAINAQAGSDSVVGNANDRDGADTRAEVQAIVDAYLGQLYHHWQRQQRRWLL